MRPRADSMVVSSPATGTSGPPSSTKAEPVEKDGTVVAYRISGRKQWISNGGFAQLYTILAQAPDGPTFFVVEKDTPGLTAGKKEEKHGIRASDTATLIFENCRVPGDHLLGSAEVKKRDPKKTGDKGFKGAMATFDASRPVVAAMAVGVGRASLDFVKEELARQGVEIRYEFEIGRDASFSDLVRDHDAVLAAMSDRWLDDCTLSGPVGRVREGVEAWFDAGVTTPTSRPRSAARRNSLGSGSRARCRQPECPGR